MDPIQLSPNGTVMQVINQVLQQDAVKIAVSSFLEGKEATGKWSIRLLGVELVNE